MEPNDVSDLVGELFLINSNLEEKLVVMCEKHLNATYNWLQNPQLRKNIDCLKAPDEIENMHYWAKKWEDKSREDYAILGKEGRHIGNCGLSNIDKIRRKAELWIYLGEAQGKGYGKSAVIKLLKRAFQELMLERVHLRVLEINDIALTFYESLGFHKECRLRNDTFQGDQYHDSFIMSILSREFELRYKPSNKV